MRSVNKEPRNLVDGLGRASLLDTRTDDTDDTKSSIPDIKTIPMRDKVVSEEGPPPVYDLFLDAPLPHFIREA